MFDPQYAEVAVVGGGPAGALAALLFARAGRRVVLLEARQRDAAIDDARALALSWASRTRLAEVGAWNDTLPCTPIDCVHVSQQDSWGRTRIVAADTGLPHLGAVVDYPLLTRALDARLESAGVRVLWGARVTGLANLSGYVALTAADADGRRHDLTARLAVLAEGGALVDGLDGVTRRTYDYRQSALLARVRTAMPHRGVAYERFSRRGPLALLPHGDDYMLVWTRSPADAERLCADPGQLRDELAEAFGERQGRILSVDATARFPLAMRRASRIAAGRVALVGNAAQTLHPVAAQGLNLGIRDAATLARVLDGETDPGDTTALAAYVRRRRLDSNAVIGFTHGLTQVFESDRPGLRQLRALGMNLLDGIAPLRRRFAGHLVFGVGVEA